MANQICDKWHLYSLRSFLYYDSHLITLDARNFSVEFYNIIKLVIYDLNLFIMKILC
jgi:hypothetical protein